MQHDKTMPDTVRNTRVSFKFLPGSAGSRDCSPGAARQARKRDRSQPEWTSFFLLSTCLINATNIIRLCFRLPLNNISACYVGSTMPTSAVLPASPATYKPYGMSLEMYTWQAGTTTFVESNGRAVGLLVERLDVSTWQIRLGH